MSKLKYQLARRLGANEDFNRKVLSIKKSWDEVAQILHADKGKKK